MFDFFDYILRNRKEQTCHLHYLCATLLIHIQCLILTPFQYSRRVVFLNLLLPNENAATCWFALAEKRILPCNSLWTHSIGFSGLACRHMCSALWTLSLILSRALVEQQLSPISFVWVVKFLFMCFICFLIVCKTNVSHKWCICSSQLYLVVYTEKWSFMSMSF